MTLETHSGAKIHCLSLTVTFKKGLSHLVGCKKGSIYRIMLKSLQATLWLLGNVGIFF